MSYKYFQKYLDNSETVCHGSTFTNINSITEDQLWGFFSMIAVNNGKPLCPICDGIVNSIINELFLFNPLVISVCNIVYTHNVIYRTLRIVVYTNR